MKRRIMTLCTAAALVATGIAATAEVADASMATGNGQTFRVNLSTSRQQANFPSTRARISHDGHFVVYESVATNMVPGDRNGVTDVYWADITNPAAPVTKRVSIGSDGSDANDESTFTEISGNGRFVVYSSQATNLVPGGSPGGCFIRDMTQADVAKATKLLQAGCERPVISDDGRYVSFNTLPITNSDIVVKDMTLDKRVVVVNGGGAGDAAESFRPEISGDGTHLIFASDSQLVPQDSNTARDVYEADLRPWQMSGGVNTNVPLRLVSVGLNGRAAGGSSSRPGINHDGSVVSFQSVSPSLVAGDGNGVMDAFVRDYRTNPNGTTSIVSYGVGGNLAPWESSRPQLDDSGDTVVFVSNSPSIVPGDTNNHQDSFIRNWADERKDGPGSHTTSLGVSPAGDPGACPGIRGGDEGHQAIVTRPYISGDANAVVFVSGDCNLTPDAAHGGPDTNLLTDIFVRRFDGGPAGSCLRTVGPARLMDTRLSGGMVAAGETRVLGVTGSLVPLGAVAAVLNVTLTQPAAPGFVTAYPADQARPLASNVNVDRAGQTIAGLATVPLSAAGSVAFFSSMPTHLVIDVMGWVGAGCGFTAVRPVRVLDTRPGGVNYAAGKPAAGGRVDVDLGFGGVPANAAAVAVNVTATQASAPGYVTVWPAGLAQPLASNLNLEQVGQTIANAATVGVGSGGRISLYTSGGTHLIVDVAGYWTAGSSLAPITPTRVLDTRPGSALGYSGPKPAAGSMVNVPVAQRLGKAPGTLRAVVVNVTVTETSGPGYVTIWPSGQPQPGTSNLNMDHAGQTIPNLAVIPVGADGSINLFSDQSTHYVLDVTATI